MKDGGAAFPRPASVLSNGDVINNEQFGMSLRDYFAAKIGAAVIMSPRLLNGSTGCTPESMAQFAYACSDALLAEKAKGGAA